MQNTTIPSPFYQGCTIYDLPITIPFRIQYNVKDKDTRTGVFIILPFELTAQGPQVIDFTKKDGKYQEQKTQEGEDEIEFASKSCQTEIKQPKRWSYEMLKGGPGYVAPLKHKAKKMKALRKGQILTTVISRKMFTNSFSSLDPVPTNLIFNNSLKNKLSTVQKNATGGEHFLTESTAVTECERSISDTELDEEDPEIIIIKREPNTSEYENVASSQELSSEHKSMVKCELSDSDSEDQQLESYLSSEPKDVDKNTPDLKDKCIGSTSYASGNDGFLYRSSMNYSDHTYEAKKKVGRSSKKKIATKSFPSEEKKKRNLMVEKEEVIEIRKPKLVKVEEIADEETEGYRRKSTRLRSVGFRPDYEDVENKIDEIFHDLDVDDDGEDQIDAEGKNDNLSTDEVMYVSENEIGRVDKSIDSKNSKTVKRSTKHGKRSVDPDFDPNEFIKEKKAKSKDRDESENEESEIMESSDSDSYYSSVHSDDFENDEEKTVIKPKKKKKRIQVKLEEHADKYTLEVLESKARKDRGKSETERSLEVYACILCRQFKSEGAQGMEEHLEQHLNGELNCKQCDYSACSVAELRRHRKQEHLHRKDRICPECGMKVRVNKMKDHLGSIHDDPQYECMFCSENTEHSAKYITAHHLHKHIQEDHREKCYICKYCGKAYFVKKMFKRHEEDCLNPAWCEKCGQKFSSAAGLKRHMDRVHLKIKRYQCSECSYATISYAKLMQHKLVHGGTHPFSCTECDFTCIQSYQLTSHMRTHTGEKPYKCDQCSYAAAWNVQLKDHIKVHDLETAVMCHYCNILFKNDKTLALHMKKQQCSL